MVSTEFLYAIANYQQIVSLIHIKKLIGTSEKVLTTFSEIPRYFYHFIMNAPDGPKKIFKYPTDTSLKQIILRITSSDQYINAPYFRNQLLILKESIETNHEKHITHQQLADLFNTTKATIKHQLEKAKKESEGKINSNGRPFILNQIQINQLRDWVSSAIQHPKVNEVKAFVEENFEKSIDQYRTMQLVLQKAGLKTELAEPMDADRYFADTNKINYYYSVLESFCNTYDIPSQFVLNADEEGHEDYSDSRKQLVVVTQETKGPVNYPVKRTNDHTTFLACITADGSYLKPLVVVKRKTIEARVFRAPIFDKIYICENESGFITSSIFDDWLSQILIPYIVEKRKQHNYHGPAVLILDGCSCHYTPALYRLCSEHSIKIFFLPPHSSNQTQPLDLVVFHLHKDKIRQFIKLDSEDSMLCEKLKLLYSAFQSIATLQNIQASFEAAGAVYESSATLYPIVHFDRNFATHLLSNPKTKKEKKELSKKRKGLDLQEHESRLRIEDIQSYWKNESDIDKIPQVMKKVPRIIDPKRDAPIDPFHRLLQAFVVADGVENSQFYPEQPKGRPKKQQQPKEKPENDDQLVSTDQLDEQKNEKCYLDLDIRLRLECELKYVGILDSE